MDSIVGTIITAAGMFAGTNVDDLVVLTVLFLGSRATGRPRRWQVWAGQYVGIAVLVAVSGAAALGLTVVPDDKVGLLGFVPLGLGVWGLVRAVRARGASSETGSEADTEGDTETDTEADTGTGPEAGAGSGPVVANGIFAVAGVTIANGADNLSVYTPVFRTLGVGGTVVTLAVFAAGVALWCLAASWLGSHARVVGVVERYGRWIVPVVFMLIGALILIESGIS